MVQYGQATASTASAARTARATAPGSQPAWLIELLGGPPTPARLKVQQKDLLIFFRQLAVILQSGVPLAQGLQLLADNMTNPNLAGCIRQIALRLNAGEELSVCLRQYPRVFRPITIGLIEAGEAGGILEAVLDRIAHLMEQQAKLRGQMIGALIYPVIVLVLAITVGLALLIFIVPRFENMFNSLGAKLPALTQFMLNASRLVTNPAAMGIAAGLVVGGGMLFRSVYASKEGRLAIDTWLFKIPLFGPLILRYEMASLSETLATLVNSGIPIIDGLQRCISASSNQLIRNTITRSIVLAQQGQPLSVSLDNNKALPNLFIAMVRIGEETGELSFMLEKLAIFYNREIESAVTALTKAMEPATVMVVAGIVGTIVISLYLPMFDLIRAFKK
jgi:type IV pilus assembly protein PilC